MEIRNYRRRSVEVQAVFITLENFQEVARWAGTQIRQDWGLHDGRPFIEIKAGGKSGVQPVPVFIGDWITRQKNGQFNRASEKTFTGVFEEVKSDRFARYHAILELLQKSESGVPFGDIAQQILDLP
jgi:hypothetical protein